MRVRMRPPIAFILATFCWHGGLSSTVAAEPRPTSASRQAPPQNGSGARSRGDSAPLRAAPEAAARSAVTAGATATPGTSTLDNRELQLLREAERVLFPEPTYGLVPGWTWDVSRPIRGGRPGGEASGLPSNGGEPSVQNHSGVVEPWIKSLTRPTFEVRLDGAVITYLKFYRDSARGRTIAQAWTKRSGRYAPSIRAMLESAGLPVDLVWMSLVESGHDPLIKSPAGAAGLWQFVPSTARMYGLTVDRWVDERLDPRRATEGAILMLSDLHQRFGNWSLVMAAYNMGFGGLARAIRKYNTNDFFELTRFEAGVPWETSLYVPKIMATALMMNNRSAFGLGSVQPDSVERFDSVRVESGTPLADIAAAAGVTLQEFKANNPQFLEDRLPPAASGAPPRSWTVRLPAGAGAKAAEILAKRGNGTSALVPYVVRFGDSVQSISADMGFEVDRLRDLNGIGLRESLRPGSVILLPRSGAAARAEKALVIVSPSQVSYRDRRRVFYEVSGNETLAEVAHALAVDVDELVQHNALDESARLQSGMVLQAFVAKDADLRGVRHFTDQTARVLIAGTDSFYDHFEGLNGQRRFIVKAQKGDTLAVLAKRYGMTPGSIERVNRRSRNDELKPGERVVIYGAIVPRSQELAGEVAVAPLTPITEPAPEQLPPVPSSSAN